jgi:hypothetical protein
LIKEKRKMSKFIQKPDVSPDFTLEDIRKIRHYHYEIVKDMSTDEKVKFYNSASEEFEKLINSL